jgi:mercuric ion transport protein
MSADATARGTAPDATHRWSLATTAGAVASAFLASLCCLGPLAFAVLGLGGAGLLLKFEPYRPYFTALTVGLLGAGFWFTYRRPRQLVTDGPECACEHPKSNRLGRVMLWVATVLVVAFLSFPYLAPYLFD